MSSGKCVFLKFPEQTLIHAPLLALAVALRPVTHQSPERNPDNCGRKIFSTQPGLSRSRIRPGFERVSEVSLLRAQFNIPLSQSQLLAHHNTI